MPLNPKFEKIKAEMIKKHGEKKGTQMFHAWVNQQKLDDTKSLSSQKKKLKKGKETEMFDGDLRFNSLITSHSIITEGEKKWCKIGGTAMTIGKSRNKVNYTDVQLSENDGREVKFFVEHEGDTGLPLRVDDIVGAVKFKKENDKLKFDGRIRNTIKHPEITETAKDGLLDISVDARYKTLTKVKESDGGVHYDVTGFEIRALCGVGVGGIADSSVDYAITERFKSVDELNSMAIKESELEVNSTMEEKDFLKEKENLIKEKEDMKKELDDMKVKENERIVKEKEQVVESILEFNKELKEKELMEKPIAELEMMVKYEKQLKEAEEKAETPEEKKKREEAEAEAEAKKKKGKGEGKGDVEPKKKESEEGDGFIIEKETGNITMSETLRQKLHDEIKERYW